MKPLYHIHYVILEPDGFERGEDEYVRAGERERVERHAEAYLLREVFELDGDRLAAAAELERSLKGYWRNPAGDDCSARYDLEPIDAVPVIDLDTADQAADSRQVEKWVYSGELSSEVERAGVTFDEVLHAAGRVLDQSSACEMIGEVLFLGTDGQWYTLTVEAVIAPADADYVRDSLGLTNEEAQADRPDTLAEHMGPECVEPSLAGAVTCSTPCGEVHSGCYPAQRVTRRECAAAPA